VSRIGLIDVDSHNWPSLPLMKLSAYHKALGDDVEPWFGLVRYDRVYMSKVFTDSPDVDMVIMADEIVKGGTGYAEREATANTLPDTAEHIYPDYSLYPQYAAAYGFLTRGCPRGCGFCSVGKKEGSISRQVADLDEFWRGQQEIKLLDPNLFACADHENLLRQLIDSGAWVDFTQGLDIRLTTEQNIELLSQVKIKRLHFSWDNPREDLTGHFQHFKALSGIEDYRKLGVYVLTNFNSTFDEDLHRIYTLRDLGYSPYVMVYDKMNAPRKMRLLQRWVNNRIIFASVPRFEDYDCRAG